MTKRTNRLRRMLAVTLAVMMILTGMNFGMGGGTTLAWAENNNAEGATAPQSLTVELVNGQTLEDGTIIAKKGDVLRFSAKDQDENPTEVEWSTTSSWIGSIDQVSGTFTFTSDIFAGGGISFLYIKATSKVEPSIAKEQGFNVQGYTFSTNHKNYIAKLSEDGQNDTLIDLSGGVQGHSIWSHTDLSKVAGLTKDPGSGSRISFAAYRPGKFQVTVKLDIGENLTDTADVTIRGVAVEDEEGNRKKTYLDVSSDQQHPQATLQAFCEEGQSIAKWESADPLIAAVDENGVVTAQGIGTTLITANDTAGKKGGIMVVVQDSEKPYFENLQFMSRGIKNYTTVYNFKPDTLNYALEFNAATTSTLTFQTTTLYDTEKYKATATYTDIEGKAQNININSGSETALPGIPFEENTVTVTLEAKDDPTNQTVYTFKITRPRDTTKQIRAASYNTTAGLILKPEGRALLASKYNGQAEGTLFKADETGTTTSGTGFTASTYYYRTYLLQGEQTFKLELASSTIYAHLRYSADEGKTWTELPQGGGLTESIAIPAAADAVKINIQVLDDKTYTENKAANGEGFAQGEPTNYFLWVESVQSAVADAQILTAVCDDGEWYAPFDSNKYSYTIVVPAGITEKELTYTVSKDAVVKIGSAQQTADAEGNYKLTLKTSPQTLTITSADGSIANTYRFKLQNKLAGRPDKVIDYLCIGSQYTNRGDYGTNPEATLTGTLKSLGNFGGYITYYYEDAIQNDPNNKYGIDFYAYGNAFVDGGSAAEPGQVYVSKDNKTWYALAGSEHYEDKAIWDYTITYTKGTDGKAYWTDNQGNKMVKTVAKDWPSSQHYYLNDVPNQSTYSYTGLVLKSQEDNTITGTGNTTSWSAETKFG